MGIMMELGHLYDDDKVRWRVKGEGTFRLSLAMQSAGGISITLE